MITKFSIQGLIPGLLNTIRAPWQPQPQNNYTNPRVSISNQTNQTIPTNTNSNNPNPIRNNKVQNIGSGAGRPNMSDSMGSSVGSTGMSIPTPGTGSGIHTPGVGIPHTPNKGFNNTPTKSTTKTALEAPKVTKTGLRSPKREIARPRTQEGTFTGRYHEGK